MIVLAGAGFIAFVVEGCVLTFVFHAYTALFFFVTPTMFCIMKALILANPRITGKRIYLHFRKLSALMYPIHPSSCTI